MLTNKTLTMKTTKELRVVFWHVDFPDGSIQNETYGRDGLIYKRVLKNIPPETILKWHFHGDFIHPNRVMLLKRLKRADVLIVASPWNMNVKNIDMNWEDAEKSLLKILRITKQENLQLKIFFLLEPTHLIKELKELGEVVNIDDEPLYNYFLNPEL